MQDLEKKIGLNEVESLKGWLEMLKKKRESFEQGKRLEENIDVQKLMKEMDEKKIKIQNLGTERMSLQSKIDSLKSSLEDFISKREIHLINLI